MKIQIKFLTILSLFTTIVSLSGCNNKNTIDDKKIIVGASSSPHAEILAQTKTYIEEHGYSLEIVEFDDYILPNVGVEDGSLDANYFQHLPYLEDYNANIKTSLVSAGKIHFEPLSVYSKTQNSEKVKQNGNVGIPNDKSNGERALRLLEQLDWISLDSNASNISINSISSNPYNLHFVEFTASILPTQLDDLDYAIINGNYALSANITAYLLDNASELSTSIGADTYANIVACKKENQNKEAINILINALKQDNVKSYIENTYKGTVLPYKGE